MEMKIHGAHKHAHPGIAKDPKKGNGHSPGTCASYWASNLKRYNDYTDFPISPSK